VIAEINLTLGKKGKANPVTGRGGPWGYVTSRLPHFLYNRLTDNGEVVSLMRRAPFPPRKISGTHFCYRLTVSGPQSHSAAGRIRSVEKSSDLIPEIQKDINSLIKKKIIRKSLSKRTQDEA
jgi:hypothetical protein